MVNISLDYHNLILKNNGDNMHKVKEFLEKELKLKDGDVLVIGNSYGPDSMALMDILLKLKKKINISIVVAHVNHNVREESAKEKQDLESFCRDKDVIFESMVIEQYGDDNFENEARNIRYNFFEDLVRKYNANYLLTAHHGDDLIETVIMRIVRGSTLKGYSGFSKIVDMGNYKIVRPLIYVTKDEIIEYDEKNNIPYAIDKSNFKDTHTRNRYRHTVLPFLKSEDPKVHEKFLKYSTTLLEYDEYINKEISRTISKVYKDRTIDLPKYLELDPLIQKKLIYCILEDIYKDDLMIINDNHVKLLKMLIKSKKANSYVYLPHNIKAVKVYDKIMISDRIKEPVNYEIELSDYVELPNGHSITKILESDKNDNNICRISNDDIVYPLYVRTRKYGDKMQLKKINGSRRIKDIFIDAKVPLLERDTWPIVVDSCDKIIWIPGIKKSKFTKQKSETYDIILRYD